MTNVHLTERHAQLQADNRRVAERYAAVQAENRRVVADNARLHAEIAHLRHERDRALEVADELRLGLETRVLIEQAKGIISVRAGVPLEAAFELLRGYADDADHHQDIHIVSAGVVAVQEHGTAHPEPVQSSAGGTLALMSLSRGIRDHYNELTLNGLVFE